MLEECEKLLEKNEVWKSNNKEDRKKILMLIEKRSWEILDEIGIPLKYYLETVKRFARKNKKCYWFSMLGSPIIIGKWKSMDRKKEILKLKKLKFRKEFEKADKVKKKINLDDLNYIRINIKTGEARKEKRYIKIRIKKKGNILDINALENGLSPSTTHSEDASILMKLILRCKRYKVRVVPIHDSAGAKIYFASLLKVIYKESFIEYIKYCLSEKEFPIGEIVSKEDYAEFKQFWEERKTNFMKRKKNIIKEVRKSKDIFI